MRASKKVKGAVLLTAGAALILGAPTVYADSNTGSSNNGGLLNGVQLLNGVNLNIPINACGVGALLGDGSASCASAAGNDNGGSSRGGHGGNGANSDSQTSSRNDRGILNGLQVGNNLTANVPVNVCGVGALLASGEGNCSAKAGDGNGGNALGVHSRGRGGGNGGSSDRSTTSRNRGGLLNGAQVLNNSDLNVPVDLCGVGLLLADGTGNCSAKAGNDNGGSVYNGGRYYRGHDGREYRDYRGRDGREWREDRSGGHRSYWGGGSWHSGGAGNGGSDDRNTSSSNRGGLLNGLQLLNNSDLNVPVTVCGLAVLGSADCGVNVEAGNRNGGDAYGYRGNGNVEGGYTHHRHWENEVLPHTGAAGLALLPFGLALVAGGVALRRRVSSQR
jgi:hypothetical protein